MALLFRICLMRVESLPGITRNAFFCGVHQEADIVTGSNLLN